MHRKLEPKLSVLEVELNIQTFMCLKQSSSHAVPYVGPCMSHQSSFHHITTLFSVIYLYLEWGEGAEWIARRKATNTLRGCSDLFRVTSTFLNPPFS